MVPIGPVIVTWANRPKSISRFLLTDRDGVLVEDWGVPPDARVRIFPEAAPAIAALGRAGFSVVVVTNQSCVSRGGVTLDQLLASNETALALLDPARAVIGHVVICPHAPEDLCSCRKPKVGGIRALERELGRPLGDGWFVGDQRSDMECGQALGLRTALVETGYGARTWAELPAADRAMVTVHVPTFAHAVEHMLTRR